MIYSANTPKDEIPWYCLPELGDYFMSKSEQYGIKEALTGEIRDIKHEMRGIEIEMESRYKKLKEDLAIKQAQLDKFAD